MCRAEHSAVLREVQVKTAPRCYPEPLKGATVRRTDSSRAWEGCGDRNSLTLLVGI